MHASHRKYGPWILRVVPWWDSFSFWDLVLPLSNFTSDKTTSSKILLHPYPSILTWNSALQIPESKPWPFWKVKGDNCIQYVYPLPSDLHDSYWSASSKICLIRIELHLGLGKPVHYEIHWFYIDIEPSLDLQHTYLILFSSFHHYLLPVYTLFWLHEVGTKLLGLTIYKSSQWSLMIFFLQLGVWK